MKIFLIIALFCSAFGLSSKGLLSGAEDARLSEGVTKNTISVVSTMKINTGEITIYIRNTSQGPIIFDTNCIGANADGRNILLPNTTVFMPFQYNHEMSSNGQDGNYPASLPPMRNRQMTRSRYFVSGVIKTENRVICLLPGEFFGKTYVIWELKFWDEFVRDINRYGRLRLYPYFEINDENGASLGMHEGEGVIIDKEILQQLLDIKARNANAKQDSGE